MQPLHHTLLEPSWKHGQNLPNKHRRVRLSDIFVHRTCCDSQLQRMLQTSEFNELLSWATKLGVEETLVENPGITESLSGLSAEDMNAELQADAELDNKGALAELTRQTEYRTKESEERAKLETELRAKQAQEKALETIQVSLFQDIASQLTLHAFPEFVARFPRSRCNNGTQGQPPCPQDGGVRCNSSTIAGRRRRAPVPRAGEHCHVDGNAGRRPEGARRQGHRRGWQARHRDRAREGQEGRLYAPHNQL